MPVNLNDKETLGRLLEELYQAQKSILFQEMVVQIFMERTGLSEDQVITMLKKMLDEGWLVAGGSKPKFFLRPGYVTSFPVVISRKGLQYLKDMGVNQ